MKVFCLLVFSLIPVFCSPSISICPSIQQCCIVKDTGEKQHGGRSSLRGKSAEFHLILVPTLSSDSHLGLLHECWQFCSDSTTVSLPEWHLSLFGIVTLTHIQSFTINSLKLPLILQRRESYTVLFL